MQADQLLIKVAGGLLLLQMTTAIVSYSVILDPILYGSTDFLTAVSSNAMMVRLAALLDFITTLAYLGVAVILFPILKRYSERIALWFVSIRLSEFVTLTLSAIFLLSILSISQSYVAAVLPESASLQTLGKQLVNTRIHTQNLNLLAYCFGTSLLFYLLLTSRLIPRFISIWGLIGVAGLLTEIMMSLFGYSTEGFMYYLMMPIGLCEIFLGFWLIVKGLNLSAPTA